ncbi:MAG: lipid-A-disaccharide synthase [Bacteroidales bacterium]|nr:lipid-A-disaccharide synthase [Bacteroidales bacterium]
MLKLNELVRFSKMKYYIIAGEASGDLHGSNLMKGIYAQDPTADIRFWGGEQMCGVFQNNPNSSSNRTGLVRHYKEGAVMGFVEVLAKAGRLLKNVDFCKKDILAWNPDVVILIDYPGFNFKIAEFAHKAGFKVFYYIAPKVWASREGRIRKLKKYVDKLYIVFPFEKPYFESKGVDYIYKGNPLVDAVDGSKAMNESREDFLNRTGLEDKPVIAMLAGSRKSEINTMMPVLTEFASKMHNLPQYTDYQFLIAGAPARSIEDYSEWMDEGNSKYIKVLFGETQSIIRHAEAGVINSGTASLETALFGTPQVVGYIINPLTYWLAKKIIKVKYISLGNLIVDRLAFKEFIQHDCNPDALAAEVRDLIENQKRRSDMLAEYAEIRSLLGGSGASDAVARSMIEELSK